MNQQGRNIYYRHFDLPANFPVIGLLGDSWLSYPEPLSRMHFHNCVELGLLHSGKGTLYMGDHVQMVRIDRACVLLYNCDYSVTEIGLQVGYPSPSSFNRQFRRIHGVSPSQWRQKMRSEENPVVTAYFNSLPPSNFQFFPVEYHNFSK